MKQKLSLRVVITILFLMTIVSVLTARVVAQQDEMFVTIAQVDSQSFPEVSAYVSVSDEQGSPIPGLTLSRFEIKEDDSQTVFAPTSVQSVDSLNLNVALVLDVSMEEAELTKVKQAALALLDVLTPDDNVALLIFYEKVEVLGEFGSDIGDLRKIITGLEVKGATTNLYEAAFEAAVMTSDLPAGRKAVIILSNYEDNIKARSSQDVLDIARTFEFPIYTLGFGTEFQADPFHDMLSVVGGRMFCHYDLDEMPNTVQNLASDLRKGYQVTFQSDFQADKAEHLFQVDVNWRAQRGQATAHLFAFPGQVNVIPLNVSDDFVTGIVELGAQATGPGEIISMTFFIDGEPVAELAGSPSQVSWDSSGARSGGHTLTIKAVDSAGNLGKASVQLNVAPPPQVTVSVKPEKATLGENVAIEAQVDSPVGITMVSFWLDEELLAQDDTPPFTLDTSFDSAKYAAGQYNLTAQADDSLGQSGQSSRSMQLSSPPALVSMEEKLEPLPKLVSIIAILASLLALILIPFLIPRYLLGVLRKKYQQRYYLAISNLGNIIGFYELRAEEPTRELDFKFSLNGTPLRHRQEMIYVDSDIPVVHPSEQEELVPVPVPAQAPLAQAAGGEQEAAPKKALVAKKGSKSFGRFMGLGGKVADAMGLLATLLPGSLGMRFKGMSANMRQRQAGMQRTVRAPQQMKLTAGQLTSKVKPKQAVSISPAAKRTPNAPPQPTSVEQTPAAAPQVAQMSVNKTNGRSRQTAWAASGVAYQWSQTPPLEPGETLDLNLYVSPIKSSQSGYYSFDIISRLIEQGEDHSQLPSHEPEMYKGQFHCEGISLLDRLGFVISSVIAFAICSLGVITLFLLLSMLL